jgi:hypothetical protein
MGNFAQNSFEDWKRGWDALYGPGRGGRTAPPSTISSRSTALANNPAMGQPVGADPANQPVPDPNQLMAALNLMSYRPQFQVPSDALPQFNPGSTNSSSGGSGGSGGGSEMGGGSGGFSSMISGLFGGGGGGSGGAGLAGGLGIGQPAGADPANQPFDPSQLYGPSNPTAYEQAAADANANAYYPGPTSNQLLASQGESSTQPGASGGSGLGSIVGNLIANFYKNVPNAQYSVTAPGLPQPAYFVPPTLAPNTNQMAPALV